MAAQLLFAVQRLLRSRGFRTFALQAGPLVAQRAVTMAQQGRWRRLAVMHADSLVEGRLSREVVEGEVVWVVWKGDDPVEAYPPVRASLPQALADRDRDRPVRPDQLPTRRWRRQGADRARAATHAVRHLGRNHGEDR